MLSAPLRGALKGDDMIKYGKILKMHEKDNPSPFCRASYLISNVGDMIKCYGRMLRFPDDAHIYQKEMELAMGDVIMQCRLIQVENNIEEFDPQQEIRILSDTPIEYFITKTLQCGTDVMIELKLDNKNRMKENIRDTLTGIYIICNALEIDFNEIQHLGFIHTIERFKEFERRGWQ